MYKQYQRQGCKCKCINENILAKVFIEEEKDKSKCTNENILTKVFIEEEKDKGKCVNENILTKVFIEDEKDKSKWVNENILTRVYIEEGKVLIDNNRWMQKKTTTTTKTVKIFWNNNTISEICERWALFCNTDYMYIRSKKLYIHLGELLYTREHKADLSKKISCHDIDIDELKMFIGDSIFKPTKEYIDMYNKISNRIDIINDLYSKIVKIEIKLKKNLSYIDDSQLKYKINAKIEDILSFIWFEIYKKKEKI